MSSPIIERCDFVAGDIIRNRYTVKKTLGEGSFGKVYMVHDKSGQTYACKLLRLWEVPPDIRQPLMERFEMEFRTGQIDCENLVRSMDYGKVGGNPYIIMEYCPYGDLTPYLGHADERAVLICQQILVGLNALHIQGKVHRDLKPENVLFKANGQAALTDFGIAGDRTHRMTQRNIFGRPNQIFGTYAYMPPEQVNRTRGGATVLPTTDIFSFGVLTFQLLTGKLPFGSLESHNELAEYQLKGKRGQWNQNLLLNVKNGKLWEQVIANCLVPDFKQRLQTVGDVMKLLPHTNVPMPSLFTYQQCNVQNGTFLHVMDGEDYGRVYNLLELSRQRGRILTIGRMPDNVICLKSDKWGYVSRWHATIEANPEIHRWAIRDGQWRKDVRAWHESSNGLYVNSVKVDRNGRYLMPGDIITLGDVKIRFEHHY